MDLVFILSIRYRVVKRLLKLLVLECAWQTNNTEDNALRDNASVESSKREHSMKTEYHNQGRLF